MMTKLGRVTFVTGLSSLRDRAANLCCRLAALRFNPSRRQRIIGVGSMLFLTGAGLGAQGHVALSLFEFTLAGLCLWQLHREAGDPSREVCPIPEMDGSPGFHAWRPLISNPRIERCIFCCRDRPA